MLAVRDEAAIGAILPCGRCGSMVHVVPPAGWKRHTSVAPPAPAPWESNTAQGPGAAAEQVGTTEQAVATELPGSAVTVHRDSPDFRGEHRENGTIPLGAEGDRHIFRPATGRKMSQSPARAAVPADSPPAAGPVSQSAALPGPPPVVRPLGQQGGTGTQAAGPETPGVWAAALGTKSVLLAAGTLAIVVCGVAIALLARPWPVEPEVLSETAAVAQPSQPEGALADGTSVPSPLPAKHRCWLPAQTRCVVGLRVSELGQYGWADRLWEAAEAVWDPTAGRLMQAFGLRREDVRQLTWAVTDLSAWRTHAVALIELEAEDGTARWREAGQPSPLQAGGLAWRQLADSAWPHPFTVLDGRTLITGTPELLAEFSGDSSPPLASKPLGRLLQVGAWDGHFVLLDLEAARQAGWTRPAQWLDVWPAGRDAWRTLWDVPQGLGIVVQPQQSPEATAVAVCQGLSAAEKVRQAVEQLLPAAGSALEGLAGGIPAHVRAGRLGAALADRYEGFLHQCMAALRAARCEVVEADVFLRLESQPHVASLAEAALHCPAAMVGDWLAAGLAIDEANHFRLLGGLRAYAKAEGRFPPGAGGGTLLPPSTRLSWIALALPYLDRRDWRRELDPAYSWNSPHNRPVSQRRLEMVINPLIAEQATEAGFPVTHYVGVAGVGADAGELPASDPRAGMFGFSRSTRPEDLPRGASHTLAILGVMRDLGPWAAGGHATIRPLTRRPYVNGPDGFGSGQPHGMVAGMADGSVRFISKDIDPAVLEQLATLRGLGPSQTAGSEASPPLLPSTKPEVSEIDRRPAASPPQVLPAPDVPGMPMGQPGRPQPPTSALPATPSDDPSVQGAAPGNAPAATEELSVENEDQRPLDIEARLADMMPGIRFNATPLITATRLLSQISTIPVAFDFEGLTLAGVTLQDPITLELNDASLGEVFKAVLAARRLDFLVQTDHLLVTSAAPGRAQFRAETYSVSDLVSGPAGVKELGDRIRRLVAPETWREAGGPGSLALRHTTLEVTQSAAVHHQIRTFLAKLRTARTRPPEAARQVLATRYDLARARLRQPVTSNFIHPTPWLRILADLEQVSGTTIVVDWAAVSAAGIRPDAPATLRAHQESLSEALVALLQPLGLTYRIATPEVLEVTTRKAVAARLELEFYPVRDLVPPGDSGEALANRVKAQIAPESWSDAGGPGAIVFDPPSACLLVLQSQHTQVRVQLLLARWLAGARQPPPATIPDGPGATPPK